MRSWILIAALPLIGACQVKQSGEAPPAPPTQAEAEKIAADAEGSYISGNADAIMAHYADGAVLFDQGILTPIADRQMQTKLTQGFAAMQPKDLSVANRTIQVLDGDTFVSSGVATYTVQLGQARQPVRARFTQVYERQSDGSWKIAHEHMSAPPAGSPLP